MFTFARMRSTKSGGLHTGQIFQRMSEVLLACKIVTRAFSSTLLAIFLIAIWAVMPVNGQHCRTQDLGTLGGNTSRALGVFTDGRVVVGNSDIVNGNQHAFRWTAEGGMEDLGALPGGMSFALDVSADGNVGGLSLGHFRL